MAIRIVRLIGQEAVFDQKVVKRAEKGQADPDGKKLRTLVFVEDALAHTYPT